MERNWYETHLPEFSALFRGSGSYQKSVEKFKQTTGGQLAPPKPGLHPSMCVQVGFATSAVLCCFQQCGVALHGADVHHLWHRGPPGRPFHLLLGRHHPCLRARVRLWLHGGFLRPASFSAVKAQRTSPHQYGFKRWKPCLKALADVCLRTRGFFEQHTLISSCAPATRLPECPGTSPVPCHNEAQKSRKIADESCFGNNFPSEVEFLAGPIQNCINSDLHSFHLLRYILFICS